VFISLEETGQNQGSWDSRGQLGKQFRRFLIIDCVVALATLTHEFEACFDLSPSLGTGTGAPLVPMPSPGSCKTFRIFRWTSKTSESP
jgi:hypothetical protein